MFRPSKTTLSQVHILECPHELTNCLDAALDTLFNELDVAMLSVDGTLTELYAMTLPFASQINTAARDYFC